MRCGRTRSANRWRSLASTPATAPARSNVHSAARARSASTPVAWVSQEIGGGQAFLEEKPVDCERCRQVGARANREVQVGVFGERRPAWIDDDQLGAAALCCANDRHEVDAGCGRIGAPDDDELRVEVVLVGDAGHTAVDCRRRRAGRRRADRAGELRGAKAAKEARVGRVLGEQPVRSAVAEGEDRFGARAPADLVHRSRNDPERLVPGDALELALALRALPDGRMQEPRFAVHADRRSCAPWRR